MHEGFCKKGWRDSPTQEYNALQRNQAQTCPLCFALVDPPTSKKLLISEDAICKDRQIGSCSHHSPARVKIRVPKLRISGCGPSQERIYLFTDSTSSLLLDMARSALLVAREKNAAVLAWTWRRRASVSTLVAYAASR